MFSEVKQGSQSSHIQRLWEKENLDTHVGLQSRSSERRVTCGTLLFFSLMFFFCHWENLMSTTLKKKMHVAVIVLKFPSCAPSCALLQDEREQRWNKVEAQTFDHNFTGFDDESRFNVIIRLSYLLHCRLLEQGDEWVGSGNVDVDLTRRHVSLMQRHNHSEKIEVR